MEVSHSMFKYALGIEMKDRVTGFTGIVTGRIDYITGCNQYTLQPRVKDNGDHVEAKWFDEHRLEQVGTEQVVLDDDHTKGAGEPGPIK